MNLIHEIYKDTKKTNLRTDSHENQTKPICDTLLNEHACTKYSMDQRKKSDLLSSSLFNDRTAKIKVIISNKLNGLF